MINFILGVLVGAIVGFTTCAICSVAGTDDRTGGKYTKKTEEDNAGEQSLS